jgi:hypothetical protein
MTMAARATTNDHLPIFGLLAFIRTSTCPWSGLFIQSCQPVCTSPLRLWHWQRNKSMCVCNSITITFTSSFHRLCFCCTHLRRHCLNELPQCSGLFQCFLICIGQFVTSSRYAHYNRYELHEMQLLLISIAATSHHVIPVAFHIWPSIPGVALENVFGQNFLNLKLHECPQQVHAKKSCIGNSNIVSYLLHV